MKRREFITLLSGAAMSWPLTARAQQGTRMRRIGVLMGGADDGGYIQHVAAFRHALALLGWSEGHNLATEIRWGSSDLARIKILAEELVSISPEVILAGPSHAVIAVQRATRSIPIVFVMVSDPVGQGIVDSLARPTGNATGFTRLEFSMIGKWVQLLKEIAPGTNRVALMIFTVNAASPEWYRMFETVAPSLEIEPIAAPLQEPAQIERTIEALARRPGGGLIVPGDTVVTAPAIRRSIVELAVRYRVPAIFPALEYVTEGGLMSYGVDGVDPFRRAAGYVDRILKGETPGDLPVQRPVKFQLAINFKTAKALGLTVPLTLQVAADETVE